MLWATHYREEGPGSKRGRRRRRRERSSFFFLFLWKKTSEESSTITSLNPPLIAFIYVSLPPPPPIRDFAISPSHQWKLLHLISTLFSPFNPEFAFYFPHFFLCADRMLVERWRCNLRHHGTPGGRGNAKSTRWQWETKNESCRSRQEHKWASPEILHEANYKPSH